MLAGLATESRVVNSEGWKGLFVNKITPSSTVPAESSNAWERESSYTFSCTYTDRLRKAHQQKTRRLPGQLLLVLAGRQVTVVTPGLGWWRQGCRLPLGHPWLPERDARILSSADVQGAERITTCKTPGVSSARDVDKGHRSNLIEVPTIKSAVSE